MMSSTDDQFQSSITENITPSSTVKQKTTLTAYLLGIPLGFTGAHHFYLGNYSLGLTYLCTLGLAGLGWIADWFRMDSLVADANRVNEVKWRWENDQSGMRDESMLDYMTDNRKLLECYLMLVVTGVFGSHQFYLKRYGWGIAYMFTAGLGGVGYLMDWFRLSMLHRRYKQNLKEKSEGVVQDCQYYQLDDCYACGIILGIIGIHRFYLKDYVWAVLFLLTFGFWGIGWLVDMIRMPTIVKNANARIWQNEENRRLLTGHQGPSLYSEGNAYVASAPTYVNVPSKTNAVLPPPAAPMHGYYFPAQAPGFQNQQQPGPAQNPPIEEQPVPPPPYTPVADTASAMPNEPMVTDEKTTSGKPMAP